MNRFQIASIIRKMPTGRMLTFDSGTFFRAGASVADVLQLVVGSAYEYSWTEKSPMVTIHRRAEPVPEGLRTFVTPDRAHLFEQRPDGLFQVKAKPDVPAIYNGEPIKSVDELVGEDFDAAP